jgi:hypothetical protein
VSHLHFDETFQKKKKIKDGRGERGGYCTGMVRFSRHLPARIPLFASVEPLVTFQTLSQLLVREAGYVGARGEGRLGQGEAQGGSGVAACRTFFAC